MSLTSTLNSFFRFEPKGKTYTTTQRLVYSAFGKKRMKDVRFRNVMIFIFRMAFLLQSQMIMWDFILGIGLYDFHIAMLATLLTLMLLYLRYEKLGRKRSRPIRY